MTTTAQKRTAKKYYEKNKEKILEYARKYSKDNIVRVTLKHEIRRKQYNALWDVILKEKGMYVCQLCGYDKHFSAIDMHHLVPEEKDIQFNNIYNQRPNDRRLLELDKCIAVCANCHRLIHNNIITV